MIFSRASAKSCLILLTCLLSHQRAGMVEDGLVWLHNGNRVPVDGYYGRFSEILIINRGVHEPVEEFVFQEIVRNMPTEPTMLELGAYWGHYSMWMKSQRPGAKVFMVEPESGNLETGRSNFANNSFEGTFIHAKVGRGEFEVDSFMHQRQLPRLTILHSDIQGFESQMLDGCEQTLRNGLIDYAFISTRSQALHEEVSTRLSEYGMRIEVPSGFDHETTSFDGLLFASRCDLPRVFEGFSPVGRCEIQGSKPQRLFSYLSSLSGAAAQPRRRSPSLGVPTVAKGPHSADGVERRH
jgi:hypothetical protein